MGSSNNLESSIEQSVIDANAKRRIHPGTRSADMAAGPPLVPLSELQEHLKALHHHYIKPSDSDSSVPINRETATLIATQPEGVEGQTGLYVLFKTVCDTYELLPAENYKLPPEAEGLEPVEEVKAQAPTILKADGNHKSNSHAEDDFMNVSRSGTSTRRHIRQSPSVGSAVPTVLESDEEDPDVTAKFDKLNITEEEEEDSGNTTETTEVPVIVDSYEVDEHNDGSPPPPAKVESPILEHTELESEAPDDPSSSLTPDSSEDEPEEEEKDELKEPDEEDAAESMSPIVPDAEITITAPSPIEAEGRSIEKELDKEKPKGEESEEKEEKSKEKESEEKSKEPKEEEKKDSPKRRLHAFIHLVHIAGLFDDTPYFAHSVPRSGSGRPEAHFDIVLAREDCRLVIKTATLGSNRADVAKSTKTTKTES
ncbi:hypothetical protein M7I_1244 [Glarea lozoyensis 74030]|uniref:Uncharacterized protein n=1 Tax=Glarea lozoyensis (strain ATCC 74030 / MF5533) TaxID=1104152 RepID=H0EFG9_GLAL7|nr:hypothetical protein M7I_1244 [Glarea lozoyensis 74030]